ncbi:MAG: hypothetical protein OXI49_17860 [Acidobacteriota bacterium]|nr:hypothetical protein [Acidobacteriota bacterium]
MISPIGEPDSDIRAAADDFFDLLVAPAVERFGFRIVRADRIAGTGNITDDVLAHVRESELCIVDLTGHNPNVFYECGRRHETGRPCIQLIEASQKLPFDVAGIRTIKYQFGNERQTRDTVLELQRTIEGLQETGFSTSSGASLATIAEAVNRLERRLLAGEWAQQPIRSASERKPEDIFQNPLSRFDRAMRSGNLADMQALLPQLESTRHPRTLQAAVVLAINGVAAGAETLTRLLANEDATGLDVDEFCAAISGFVQFHVTMDTEKDGLEFVKEKVDRYLADRRDVEADRRAYLYNQISMLQYGAMEFGEGLASLEKALEFEPEERSYWYNISLMYEALEMLEKSCQAALTCVRDSETPDEDHLAHAVKVLSGAGRSDEAKEYLGILRQLDPVRAGGLARTLESGDK